MAAEQASARIFDILQSLFDRRPAGPSNPIQSFTQASSCDTAAWGTATFAANPRPFQSFRPPASKAGVTSMRSSHRLRCGTRCHRRRRRSRLAACRGARMPAPFRFVMQAERRAMLHNVIARLGLEGHHLLDTPLERGVAFGEQGRTFACSVQQDSKPACRLALDKCSA